MTGVEGYVESAASGFLAGLCAARQAKGEADVEFSARTMIGAMSSYVSGGSNSKFVPMNANFGIIEDLGYRVKGGKIAKYEVLSARALDEIKSIKEKYFS